MIKDEDLSAASPDAVISSSPTTSVSSSTNGGGVGAGESHINNMFDYKLAGMPYNALISSTF